MFPSYKKGGIIMSVVLSVATNDYVIMMSDGCVYNSEINAPINNEYKKLLKLNKFVLIGYAGNLYSCENTIDGINIHMSYDDVYACLVNKARTIHNTLGENILMSVGGVSDGKIVLKSFKFTDTGFEEVVLPIPAHSMLFKDDSYNDILERNLSKHLRFDNRIFIKEMKNTINYIANRDVTVNKNTYIEYINRGD
jgi:hypothetical protein